MLLLRLAVTEIQMINCRNQYKAVVSTLFEPLGYCHIVLSVYFAGISLEHTFLNWLNWLILEAFSYCYF